MPLELSRLMDTVTAFEEQRKQLGEELLAHRLAIVDAAIKDHCDKEGITLGVRMVFDRTLNDPKFLQEFQGVLKRTGTPQVQPPQSSDSASV